MAAGEVPTRFAFVVNGLLAQHYIGPAGDLIIKYFFPENRIAGSVSATLLNRPSSFTITAIEESLVLEYEFGAFKELVRKFPDVAAFYIAYMERHWIALYLYLRGSAGPGKPPKAQTIPAYRLAHRTGPVNQVPVNERQVGLPAQRTASNSACEAAQHAESPDMTLRSSMRGQSRDCEGWVTQRYLKAEPALDSRHRPSEPNLRRREAVAAPRMGASS
jgi:hypothetical protein